MVSCRRLGVWLRVAVCSLVLLLAVEPAFAEAKPTGKALGFSNLVFRPRAGDRIGIADEDFERFILDDLRRRGLNAVDGEDSVFGTKHGSRVELMLGGTVTELDCGGASAANLVSCRMAIEWQLLDVASDTGSRRGDHPACAAVVLLY